MRTGHWRKRTNRVFEGEPKSALRLYPWDFSRHWPRHPIRFPPAFPCPRSGFHGFPGWHSARDSSACRRRGAIWKSHLPDGNAPEGGRGVAARQDATPPEGRSRAWGFFSPLGSALGGATCSRAAGFRMANGSFQRWDEASPPSRATGGRPGDGLVHKAPPCRPFPIHHPHHERPPPFVVSSFCHFVPPPPRRAVQPPSHPPASGTCLSLRPPLSSS